MNKTVRDKLVSMREEKYREFSSALIPGCENMLGVRVPVIRKYAKEILKENTDWQKILEEDDIYFEETMLRGFIIGMATLKEDDVELAKEKLAEFVPYIENWSINDSFCNAFKIAGKHGDDFIAEIEKMVKSKKEYEARAGLILLLNHYVKVDMAGKKTEDIVRCSFCNKTQSQVRKMIAGPNGTYICDDCVAICTEIIEEELDFNDRAALDDIEENI